MNDRKSLDQALGLEIRDLRKKRGMSQETLAFDAELHRTYISILERGEKSPTLTVLKRLAAALDCDPSDLVRRAEARHARSEGGDKS